MVTDSPLTGLLLRSNSITLLTTTPGLASTSGHAAISTRDQQGKVRADMGLWDISLGPSLVPTFTVWIYRPSGTAEGTLLSVE